MISELMAAERFAPLFRNQLLAALNDNLLGNALAMLVVYNLEMKDGPAIGASADASFTPSAGDALRWR